MSECKDGQCACCDSTTTIVTDMTFIEKARAHIKGDILGRPLNGREYYYLIFGCVNAEQITEIKNFGDKLKICIENEDYNESEKVIKEIYKFKNIRCGRDEK